MNGSLQKKNNLYYAVISTKDKDGNNTTVWRATGKRKKSEAQTVLNNLLVEMENSDYIKTSNILFSDYMAYWLNDVICNKVETTTLEGYGYNVHNHICPYFKQRPVKLQQLRLIHLQRYFDDKYKEGLSANLLHKHYSNMKKALDFAVKTNLIKINPITGVDLPKVKRAQISVPAPQALEKLLRAIKGTSIESAVYLTIYYGLRRGEVLGLRWCDIDFTNKTLTICNTRTRMKTDIEKQPKTESSYRTLPLMPNVESFLLSLKAEQQADKQLFGDCYTDCDYICKDKDGKPYSTTCYDHRFKKLLIQSDIPPMRLHDLRHLNATMLLRQGISAKEIQVWLGHSQISTTLDIYTHVDFEMKQSTASAIQAAIPSV